MASSTDWARSIATTIVNHLREEEVASLRKYKVFAALEVAHQSSTLSASLSTAAMRFQACSSHPGYLEPINSDGSCCDR